jgi:hypothetical protein
MSENPEFEYFEGFYIFSNQDVEVLMDETTFNEYLYAYFERHGIDPRSNAELLAYATQVEQQHFAAEQILHHPEYWFAFADPRIRILQRKPQDRLNFCYHETHLESRLEK